MDARRKAPARKKGIVPAWKVTLLHDLLIEFPVGTGFRIWEEKGRLVVVWHTPLWTQRGSRRMRYVQSRRTIDPAIIRAEMAPAEMVSMVAKILTPVVARLRKVARKSYLMVNIPQITDLLTR